MYYSEEGNVAIRLNFAKDGSVKRIIGGPKLDVDIEAICLFALNHMFSMGTDFSYGEFSGFEVAIMKFYAKIPYKTLPITETRALFSNFWNEYLQGETLENICHYHYAPNQGIMTGTLLQWLALDNNKKLFTRLTDPRIFSIDLKVKSYDGLNLEEWFVDMIESEDLGNLTKNTLKRFLIVLRANQRR